MTDTPSAADALKPCPFCGGETVMYVKHKKGVECQKCLAFIPGLEGVNRWWNTRAAAPQEVDRDWLRGFVDHVIQYALEDSKQFLETRMRDKLIDDFTEQRNFIGNNNKGEKK